MGWLVSRLVHVIVPLAAAGVLVAGIIVTLQSIWRRTRHRSAEPAVARMDPSHAEVDQARFARLEQAVDAIAIEVERIAESQRFAVKLMSEKQLDALRPPGDQR